MDQGSSSRNREKRTMQLFCCHKKVDGAFYVYCLLWSRSLHGRLKLRSLEGLSMGMSRAALRNLFTMQWEFVIVVH